MVNSPTNEMTRILRHTFQQPRSVAGSRPRVVSPTHVSSAVHRTRPLLREIPQTDEHERFRRSLATAAAASDATTSTSSSTHPSLSSLIHAPSRKYVMVSGKGGVGKTSLSASLARTDQRSRTVALARRLTPRLARFGFSGNQVCEGRSHHAPRVDGPGALPVRLVGPGRVGRVANPGPRDRLSAVRDGNRPGGREGEFQAVHGL